MKQLLCKTDNSFNYNIEYYHNNNIGSQCELILDNLINDSLRNYGYDEYVHSDLTIDYNSDKIVTSLNLVFLLERYNNHIINIIMSFFKDFINFEYDNRNNILLLNVTNLNDMIKLLKRLEKYGIIYNNDIEIKN